MTSLKIASMEQLKRVAVQDAQFFIILNGCLRSSKSIVWDERDKVFLIWNHIDDTEQELSEDQLMDRAYTNIGFAMTRGALFKDED